MTDTESTHWAWLRERPLVSELPDKHQRFVASRVIDGRFAKGALMFSDQQAFTTLWWIQSGEVKVTRSSAAGREQILYIAREGRLVLEAALLDPDGCYWVNAVCLRDTTALGLPREALAALLDRCPEAVRALLALTERRLKRSIDLVEELALKAVHSRLASFLFTNAIREGAEPDAQFTLKRDLALETVAGRIGTVREEVSRALNEFKKRGLIEFTRKEITILDLDRLEEASYQMPREF